jgi:serine/threonine-protein kinase RsbW/stage II sporulation protein AB (anti-sigma F factor)
MLAPGDTLSESFPAVPDAVGQARNALTSFARRAGVAPEQLEAVRLAASEAVTNAVVHAYPGGKGRVHISASYLEDELWLLVGDSGTGLRPRANSPGLGLGLALIAQLADEFQILSRGSGGTEIRLRFKLPQARRHSDAPLTTGHSARGQSDGLGRAPRGALATALSPA